MNDSRSDLTEFRREIDRIDESLHDLIMQRAEVVARIGEAKQDSSGPLFRPAREAEIMRRLVARHTGPLPVRVVVRIWRELIAAFTAMQGPFSAAVWEDGETDLWDLGRDHFGSTIPLARHRSARSVIQAVSSGEATVGILPLPFIDDANPWWPSLRGSDVRICARLPFLPGGNSRANGLEAFVIAKIMPVATGEDRSLLIIECAEPVSRSRLSSVLSKAGCAPEFIIGLDGIAGQGARPVFLAGVDGFVGEDNAGIAALVKADDQIDGIAPIGAYAEPLKGDKAPS
jgi:chorismate mutase-like protein